MLHAHDSKARGPRPEPQKAENPSGHRPPVLVLGIETSCDETSVAVLSSFGLRPTAPDQSGSAHGTTANNQEIKILSNIISSSLFRHKEWGGVVPEIASRHCLEQIEPVFNQALKEANITVQDLNLIAVTEGPGLIGSLFVGMGFAKSLSYRLGIPLVAVNHLEAHFAANFIGKPAPKRYVGLLVSGGHTSLTYHENGKHEMLGETEDDAVGEAYDKVAKIMGLDYPGGPLLDKLAVKGNARAIAFKKPKQEKPLDFSFSGIKTAVLYAVKDIKTGERKSDAPSNEDLAASFQYSVVRWIVEKSLAACELKGVKDLVVGGGVSANSHLREELVRQAAEKGIEVSIPPLGLTGDNAAMIARRGLELFESGSSAGLNLTAKPNLRIAE